MKEIPRTDWMAKAKKPWVKPEVRRIELTEIISRIFPERGSQDPSSSEDHTPRSS